MRILPHGLLGLALVCGPVAAAGQEVTLLQAVNDRSRREVVVELPAVDLPAGGHEGIEQPAPVEAVIPADVWMQGYTIEILDFEGNEVPRQVVHHINLMQPDRRDLFTPVMLRVGAVGQETADQRLPWFLGYRMHGGSRLLVTAMLHNPTGRSYQGVRVRVRIPYRPVGAVPASTPIMPMYLDVVPHGTTHAYDLPPGRSERSWEGRPAVSGRIVGLGAHLHRYGVLLRLEDVTAGRTLWEARPSTDSSGEIVSIPTRTFIMGRPRLEVGHTYRLTAVYENPTGETIPGGAMGALAGAVIPDDERRWPIANVDDPTYRSDRDFTLVGSRQGGGGHGGHGGGHQH
jgi:hypothetical protein